MHRILALWATPRTVSTAFERMMIERGDHEVFDEPFSATYYFSPERASVRFDRTLPRSRATEVRGLLRSAADVRPVFFKDMAYHALPYLQHHELEGFVNTFLIRDPRWALPSLHKIWPDFTPDEAGYQAQLELFDRACKTAGSRAVVIDSDELRRDPEGVIRAWCNEVGIGFIESALEWEPGMQPQWQLWREWYVDVAGSHGFRPPMEGNAPTVCDPGLQQSISAALPVFEELAAHALHPGARE